mgnify:FL=1
MAFKLSQRSLDRLTGVHPSLIDTVKLAIRITDVDFGVLMGVRTKEQQDELYEQGRSTPGPIVTWTRNSKHIPQKDGYGHAVDLGVFIEGKYIPGNNTAELSLYDDVADFMSNAAEQLGFVIKWGVIIKGERTDKGHFEYVSSVG